MNWYYWVIILGVLAIMYVLLVVRQKKQEKQSKELLETFKVGDKVITHIGIYGKIKRIYNTTYGKVCVLEIGTLDKIDIEIDMRYIAGKDEKTVVPDEPVAQEKQEPKEETKEEAKPKDETTTNEEVVEKPKDEKKSKNKKK